MQQPGQAFDRRFLIPLAPRQLGLDPTLLLEDGPHKRADPFALMPMCPRQGFCDLVLQASRPRVLVCHSPSLARVPARGYSPPMKCVLTSAFCHEVL